MGDKELPADGVVTGRGRIGGRPVHLASQDFTVAGGSAGEVHANKIADTMKAAMKTGTPFVFINDSGGARVQEGVASLSGYARIFHQNVMLSGVVPQISLICGPCAGGAAYSPALTDFIIQTRDGLIFITGPTVIKQVTGEMVSAQELGGVRAQMNKSGVVHFVAENDVEAAQICQRLLSFLPSNNKEDPPRAEPDDSNMYEPRLNHVVPREAKTGYDVRDVICADRGPRRFPGSAGRVRAQPGGGLRAAFAARTVGIVANQPKVLAGALDIDASDKGAGFVRFCNAFNIPLVTFVDIPGLSARRGSGIRRHHPARRQAALRLLGGHGAEDHGDSAQGLRRRLHRDVRQGSGRRLHAGLAFGGDRGDGRGGGGGDRLPPRTRGCGGSGGEAARN